MPRAIQAPVGAPIGAELVGHHYVANLANLHDLAIIERRIGYRPEELAGENPLIFFVLVQGRVSEFNNWQISLPPMAKCNEMQHLASLEGHILCLERLLCGHLCLSSG